MGEYNVFLCWSGAVSKAVAEAWHQWLPLASQGARPWMSSTDIPKGIPWFGELAEQLKGIRIGIICVTPDNLSAPSIHFEAGALSKAVAEQAYVCPYLFNVRDTDLGFPLAHFQTTKAQKEDTRHLFHTLHRALQTTVLTKDQLDAVFNKWWPDLESKLQAIQPLDSAHQRPSRPQEEVLEEILELVRELARRPYPGQLIGLGGFEPMEAARLVLGGRKRREATQVGPVSRPTAEEDSSGYAEPEPLPNDVIERLEKLKL
jgi:hypothetical protein